MCAVFSEKLRASETTLIHSSKNPAELAHSVIQEGGKSLLTFERRQLPNYILDPRFSEFQPYFSDSILQNFSNNRGFWPRLFRAWVDLYDPVSEIGEKVRSALSRNTGRLDALQQGAVSRHPIIEKTPDLSGSAGALLAGTMELSDREIFGISRSGRISTKFAAKIFEAAALRLSKGNVAEGQVRTFLNLVAPKGVIHESVKLFAMVGLIAGLSKRPASDDLVKSVASIVEVNFDDPITSLHTWPAVPEPLGGAVMRKECVDRVIQWRVYRSITLFFNIIERVVSHNLSHHFPARREFWLNYFNRGAVSDAWVILGSKARTELQALVRDNQEDYQALQWASLSGGASDQCALLMRIGNATVMEFSHSGRCRIWGQSDEESVPALHAPQYLASELRAHCKPEHMFTHDPYRRWRHKAKKIIEELSGQRTVL